MSLRTSILCDDWKESTRYLRRRIFELLDRAADGGLTPEEQAEYDAAHDAHGRSLVELIGKVQGGAATEKDA